MPSSTHAVIISTTTSSSKPLGYAFRDWKYTSFKLRFGKDFETSPESNACADTGYLVILGNKKFILRMVLGVEIRKMALPIPVRGLGNRIVMTNEYVILTMYIEGECGSDGELKTVCFTMEVYLVNDLKANMLIGNDTLVP